MEVSKMKNPRLRLFYFSQSLAFTYFWLAIAIPYLMYRGLSPVQAFSLMSLYQLFGVILEYPTGVIGDRFGYRRVTYLANTLNLASMLVMSLSGNYYLYLFALFLLALGNGFSSGNDMGILKTVSLNIKKDTANYNSLMDLVLFFGSIIGGLISKISYELALIVSGICMFSANIPLYFLKATTPQIKNIQSVFSIAKDGFKSLRQPTLKQVFIIVALFGGFMFTLKSIIGSYVTLYQINVATVGLFVGLGGLARSIGGKLYAEIQKQNIALLAILFAFSVIIIAVFPTYPVTAGLILFIQLLSGYIISKIDGDIHDLASDHIRASLFSPKRVAMRIVASSYLMVYGITIGVGKFPLLMYGTGLLLLIGVILAWGYLTNKQIRNKQLATS